MCKRILADPYQRSTLPPLHTIGDHLCPYTPTSPAPSLSGPFRCHDPSLYGAHQCNMVGQQQH